MSILMLQHKPLLLLHKLPLNKPLPQLVLLQNLIRMLLLQLQLVLQWLTQKLPVKLQVYS
jgi:hypothetical protein